jgi:hypothetical protein
MRLQLIVLSLREMAVLTGNLGRLLLCLAQLNNTAVGIVTNDTIEGSMLALKQIHITLVMGD